MRRVGGLGQWRVMNPATPCYILPGGVAGFNLRGCPMRVERMYATGLAD
ncbi:MAG: hypothetical protein PHX30_03610 [Candidatus Pacebacteria bacterium]|nr:hypothetical protein [Candidatus Paceibacterota bacterium]